MVKYTILNFESSSFCRNGFWCCVNGCSCSYLCKRREVSRRSSKPNATPLPLLKLIVLCSALFVNQFGINMIFPFLPFMIHDFFPSLDRTELGHKAGYLASGYFIGNFIGSFAWGWISDRVGRRPVLLFGVLATISCELLFGFSQNFSWAIIARFSWGLLNGNIGVAKTYISEICDDTNQAKGFAVVGTSGGIARLLGSVVGGFLAQPASKYTALQADFFCKYPYSLPCIVGGGISFISFLATWLFLDETLAKKKKTSTASDSQNGGSSSPSIETNSSDNSDSGGELAQSLSTNESSSSDLLLPDDVGEKMEEFELETTDSEYDATSDTELIPSRRNNSYHIFSRKMRVSCRNCLQAFSFVKLAHKVFERLTDCVGGLFTCVLCIWSYDYTKCKPQNIRKGSSGWGKAVVVGSWQTFKLILDRKVFLSVLLYGIIAFLAIVSNELLPLLLVTDHDHGGYNMDDSEIGIILMVAAIVQLLLQVRSEYCARLMMILVLQFFVFPRITKCIGYRHTYKLGCVLFAISCILLPLSNLISGPVSTLEVGSGSGSGMALDNSSGVDFCGDPFSDASINVDSVSRVPARVWVVIMLIVILNVFSRMITITSVMVLISNSTLPENRGTVNGYGQSVAALGRILGPISSAPLFAWSETSGKKWPLNYHFVFYLVVVGAIGAIIVCFGLPASSEKKRDYERAQDSSSIEVIRTSPEQNPSSMEVVSEENRLAAKVHSEQNSSSVEVVSEQNSSPMEVVSEQNSSFVEVISEPNSSSVEVVLEQNSSVVTSV